MNWTKNNKPKIGGKKYKCRCQSCGFTAKGWPTICPSCQSTKVDHIGDRFRFSSKKRKNACRVKNSKNLNKLIHGNGNISNNLYSKPIFRKRKLIKGDWVSWELV